MKQALFLVALFAGLMTGRAQDYVSSGATLTTIALQPLWEPAFAEINDAQFIKDVQFQAPLPVDFGNTGFIVEAGDISFASSIDPAGASGISLSPGDGSSVSNVPEPSTIALAGLGAAMLGARFWRRR